MKLSELTEESVRSLTDEQIDRILYFKSELPNLSADVGIVLGGKKENAVYRAKMGAKLQKEGKVRYLIVTGNGIDPTVTEAEYMKRVLLEEGVPEEVIFTEEEARTTKENFLYSAILLCRKHLTEGERSAVVITSGYHLRRSMSLARRLMPAQMKLYGAGATAVDPFDGPGVWKNDKRTVEAVRRELPICVRYVREGWMDDVIF